MTSSVEALIKVIPKIGFNVPIVIDKQGIIVKGHSRYYAAKRLDIKQIPCIISENSDKQNKSDRIYDNAIQDLAKWDNEKLSLEIKGLEFRIPEITFPSLEVMLNTMNNEITEQDMIKAELTDEMKTKDDFINIPCPECGGEIVIRLGDIKKYVRHNG